MQRHPNALSRTVLALVLGAVSLPVTSTALLLEDVSFSPEQETHQSSAMMLERREQRAAQRRQQSIQEQRVQNQSYKQRLFQSASGSYVLQDRDVSEDDRLLLRRYVKAGYCSDSLLFHGTEGMYELCHILVGDTASHSPVRGLMNHSEYIQRSLRGDAEMQAESPFQLRLRMIEEALDATTRRGDAVMP